MVNVLASSQKPDGGLLMGLCLCLWMGWTDGKNGMDGWMDGRMDGWMGKQPTDLEMHLRKLTLLAVKASIHRRFG